ncbi:MAG: PQQ-dependent sugar dehydrogenase [Vibrio sp.]
MGCTLSLRNLDLFKNSKQYLAFLSLLVTAHITHAEPIELTPEQAPFKTELVAEDLGVVWGMDWISPTQLLMTERTGKLFVLDITNKQKTMIEELPDIHVAGQGGLLDVARYDQADQTWFYFTYVKPLENGDSATTLARAQLDLSNKKLVKWQDLLVTDSAASSSQHFGSRITFDNNGHVFFGVGDRGNRDNGQNPNNQAAALLRLNLDGSIPADNPFVKSEQGNPAVWSFGHRNPQGLVFDKQRQVLWEVEHGPRGGDEINIIQPGKNYGWAKTSHGKEYWGPLDVGEAKTLPEIEAPVKVYVPSIAPSSAIVYYGDAFKQWNGNLLMGALVGLHINMVAFDDNLKATTETRLVSDLKQRVRTLTLDQQGNIYFTTDLGQLYRLSPK